MGSERNAAKEPAELIRAVAARRDKVAFCLLFEFYAPRVKSMLIRMGAASEAAEDIAQETLLTIWRKADFLILRAQPRVLGFTRSRAIYGSIVCDVIIAQECTRYTN